MKIPFLFCLSLFCTAAFTQPLSRTATQAATANSSTIQVTILLDVSGSMDGLIEQAKSQLWSMVETLGKATCNGKKPVIQIALYEYGRPQNGAGANFIKKISAFTSDLDSLSAKLFQLHTDGGDEYCGAVMVQSLKDLAWDTKSGNYKVIFIAGNESFRQGTIPWAEACTLAKEKGVTINTIYCGDKQTGIKEYWNLAGECGAGTYSNIDQNQKEENIPAPQDSIIYALNNKLNGSYLAFNSAGVSRQGLQMEMDKANSSLGYATFAKRVKVKSSNGAYNNSSWDLLDAAKADSTVFNNLDRKYLPDSLQRKSKEEIIQYVKVKAEERTAIQQQIKTLYTEREKYISNVRKENAKNNATQNLENAIQQTIRTQAVKHNVQFED